MDVWDSSRECAVIAFTACVLSLYFFRRYMAGGKYEGQERIQKKTVIVTGANSGIGKETAKELARRGGRVILACRDEAKGKEVKQEIVRETGNPNVLVSHLDLASFTSIRRFARHIIATEPRLDILINNAGVMCVRKALTENGFEMHWGVNYLGHFLLTNLLLKKLKQSAPSRVVNVSCSAYRHGTINWSDINGDRVYWRWFAFCNSKLANILFTRELAKRLSGTSVTVYSPHPGAVRTDLLRHLVLAVRVFLWLLWPLVWLVFKSPAQGAQTSLYCALSPDLEGVSGKYYSDCRERGVMLKARDDITARLLWRESEKWTRLR